MIKINRLKRGYASQTDLFCKKGTYLYSPYFRIELTAEVSGMLWAGFSFWLLLVFIFPFRAQSVRVYKWLINCTIEKSFLLLCFFYSKVAIHFTQQLILQIYHRMASKSAGVIAGCLYLGVIKAEPPELSGLFKPIELTIALLCWLPCPCLAVQVLNL